MGIMQGAFSYFKHPHYLFLYISKGYSFILPSPKKPFKYISNSFEIALNLMQKNYALKKITLLIY